MNNVVDFVQEPKTYAQQAEAAEQARAQEEQPLRDTIRSYLEKYFMELGNEAPKNLYKNMLNMIEKPMLIGIMRYTRSNQSRAAKLLNISRGTLRKKLKIYDLL